jgi:hypothetical protein
MLENFLTDELTLAVAIGGEPNPLGGAQCLANGSELGGCSGLYGDLSAVGEVREGSQRDRPH